MIPKAGCHYDGSGRCVFTVWAPTQKELKLQLFSPDVTIDMHREEYGYWSVVLDNIAHGRQYKYAIDGSLYPDPASHSQPEGVHGPSQVTDHSYQWNDDDWKGLPLSQLIIYELHVGTFTPEGTFDAVIPRLKDLVDTGINAIELMPVAQFPGARNWGYDGVYPYAVQNTYGGPDGLKRLVDACHAQGIAVVLDVIYNHLGPEGNYLGKYGTYFTKKYCTPWGDAINLDGDWADGVRDYLVDNIAYWLEVYHIDGLRLDAIHTIFDSSATSFWELVEQRVEVIRTRTGRHVFTIAESDLNDPAVLSPAADNGWGFSAQWLDDFHHALYVLLYPEGKKNYVDYGHIAQLAKAYKDGFVLSGDYVQYRKRKFGKSSAGIPGNRFVVFLQNHDQVGNMIDGKRLSLLVDEERLKLAASAMFLSPYIPMLFMGEEYGEEAPFYYFVSHSDPELIEAVKKGRKEEFAHFHAGVTPPDPQDEQTFKRCIPNWENRFIGKHFKINQWYKALIQLRNSCPALKHFDKDSVGVTIIGHSGLLLSRTCTNHKSHLWSFFNFSDEQLLYRTQDDTPQLSKILNSLDDTWYEELKMADVGELPDRIEGAVEIVLPPNAVVVYGN